MRTFLLVTALIAAHACPASAQTAKPQNDFDYLLGDWKFTAQNKEYGKFNGLWSVVKLADGQILDEYRIVNDKGETEYMTTTLRNYNEPMKRWELVGADAGGGLLDFGTANRVGNEVHIMQKFGVAEGKPALWRIRYYNIRADGFSWNADRSPDDGKTWVEGHMKLEATRTGPARVLPPLVKGSAPAPR
jgi:hypothetical protein